MASKEAIKWLFIIHLALALQLGSYVACSEPLPKAHLSPLNVDPKLDCAIRELALEFARKLQPQRGSFQSVYDALRLRNCNISIKSGRIFDFQPSSFGPSIPTRDGSVVVYADSANGDDSNPGTLADPVRTLQRAVELTRGVPTGTSKWIYLRAGTFYLADTIRLGQEDSFLTVTSYPGEEAVVSGGKEYSFDWKQYRKGMGPLLSGVSVIGQLGLSAGESNERAMFFGKVADAEDCRQACANTPTCFSFTYHTVSAGELAHMCYLRRDGIWDSIPSPHSISGRKVDIVVTDLSSQNPNTFTSLFLDGRRAVRARYPDGNPETMGLHTNPTGYEPKADGWLPPKTYPDALEVHIEAPVRERAYFTTFEIGIGGPVSMFDPPKSYWGLKNPRGGLAHTYLVPTGLQYPSDVNFVNRTWSHPETGVVHAFHALHWANWQFQLSGRDSEKKELMFAFGGWQDARGWNAGQEWYVENIFEELDSPGEWFYNASSKMLYLFPNGTLPTRGVGTALDRVIQVKGSMESLVTNVTIANVTIAHSATTFLRRYEVPGAGDGSLIREGAVVVEGVKGFLLQNCLFYAPGGNGLVINEYARDTVIEGNEFVWSGDNGIVVTGQTNMIDGTSGNQPRGVKVLRNLVHENGVFVKGAASYRQSFTSETELIGNVFFNGPRAGINFNDGFGGGHCLQHNLVFNHVRETVDHGPFNSWDRSPYLTKVRYGSIPSLTPAESNITRNFLIANYHARWPLDHDDGSSYYFDTFNYQVYGGFKNYWGHNKVAENNVYIYPDAVTNDTMPNLDPFCALSYIPTRGEFPSGWGEVWSNNTCVIGNPNIYLFQNCYLDDLKDLVPETAYNKFYAPSKYIYISCGGKQLSLQEYQKLGHDIGSTIADPADTPTIIQWGRELLGL